MLAILFPCLFVWFQNQSGLYQIVSEIFKNDVSNDWWFANKNMVYVSLEFSVR